LSSAAHARSGVDNQEQPSAPRLDLDDADDLAKFTNTFSAIAATLGSTSEGELRNAGVAGTRLLKTYGLHWVDIVRGWAANRQATTTADTANAFLLAQIAKQQAEIDQLRAERDAGNGVALWADVGSKITDAARAAQWALDLNARRPLGISINSGFFAAHDALARSANAKTGRMAPANHRRCRPPYRKEPTTVKSMTRERRFEAWHSPSR
jgi:hypothetical protein